MQLSRMVVAGLAVAVGLGALGTRMARAAVAVPGAAAQEYGQGRGAWDAPPQELNAVQRQGFRDGIEGARRDVENHRPPSVENRDEFRHPSVPPGDWQAYRDGFRRGYNQAMAHLMGGPGMPAPEMGQPMPPPQRGDWDTVPSEFNNVQRQGFMDGMEGARRDFENHRQPDVMNRDEYRHPHVAPEFRDAYRQGFQRGYNRAWAHLSGQPWQY